MLRDVAAVGTALVLSMSWGACASCGGGHDSACTRDAEARLCTCANGSTGSSTCNESQTELGACKCESDERPDGGGHAARGSNAGASGDAGGGSSVEARDGAGAAGSGGASTAPPLGTAGKSSVKPAVELVTEPTDEATYLFDETQVRTFNIIVAASDLAMIDAQPSAEQWVPAQLAFEGKMYGPFKFRYKGSLGSFKAPCTAKEAEDPKAGKCSMKLGFDQVDDNGRFYGLKKLNFHAMNNDLSFLRDRLGYSLFRDNGIAAPRAMHARVLINGKYEGLFIAVEQVDGRFTRARFTEGGEGNVYKEVWVGSFPEQRFVSSLETNSDVHDVSGILDFQTAVHTNASAVEAFIDRAYMMRYLAVDRVIVNDDGALHFYCVPGSPPPDYAKGNGNYYWYQAAAAKRFWLIPWDLDVAFDGTPFVTIRPEWSADAECTCVQSTGFVPQLPPACDGLVKHFVSWIDDYNREVDKFLSGPFSAEAVQQKLDAWTAQIEPLVRENAALKHAPGFDDWRYYVNQLKDKINAQRMHRGYAY